MATRKQRKRDERQPRRHHRRAEAGFGQNQRAGDDLDHTHDFHKCVRSERQVAGYKGSKVIGPMNEKIREFIESRHNWHDAKGETQRLLNRFEAGRKRGS